MANGTVTRSCLAALCASLPDLHKPNINGLQWWVLNGAFFGQEPPITISAALGLNGQKIYVWAAEDLVLVVQTQYEHSANQGYVLSDSNFPNTCTARNACPDSTGAEVASYSEFTLMSLLAELVD